MRSNNIQIQVSKKQCSPSLNTLSQGSPLTCASMPKNYSEQICQEFVDRNSWKDKIADYLIVFGNIHICEHSL
jgi:hypothetical protein